MLIEFSVSNFRSVRERQTLQMTASPRLAKRENVFLPDVDGEKLPALLKVAAIYGGNATGKTTMIVALGTIEKLLKLKPDAASKRLPVSAFRFDSELSAKPSVFEVHFIANRVRYYFRVAATIDRVVGEALYVFPKGRERLLYSRSYEEGHEKYELGSEFEVDESVRETWRRVTSPHVLFISQAVANSSEELKQLRIPYLWLSQGSIVLDDGPRQLPAMGTQLHFPDEDKTSKFISGFLSEIDIPVAGVRWDATVEPSGEVKKKMILTHQTRLGVADFDVSEESNGTKSLIGFWAPSVLLSRVKAPKGGEVMPYGMLVVDELDSSLHPEVVARLVKKHVESDAKTQLIFTTHDTHLMSAKILRRDQLWVTNRDANGATRIRSIHDFKGREGEDVEKRYFEGRYTGLPVWTEA